MTITLEAIRAAGGIVHSDGNIFFRDISMLQGLAGAAPAAVAVPTISEIDWDVLPENPDERARFDRRLTKLYGGDPRISIATALRLWAETRGSGFFGAQCAVFANEIAKMHIAAPALEAPAAPAVPAGYVAPKGRYVPPVLFSPYTGEPRDARDIASDPQGVLVVPPGANLLAAAPQAPAAPADAEMLAALRAVAMDVVYVGSGENAISDAARAKIEAVLEKIGAPWPGPAAAPAAPAVDARTPIKPQHPKGMTSVNARLSFDHGWKAAERAHGIRPAAQAAAKGDQPLPRS